jgi:hypothetical protein
MQSNKLIISMTSFPPRINGVGKVWYSILSQNVDRSLYRCILVLAKPEFPNGIKDLPTDLRLIIENGLVELIWHATNIKSHKKLIPTLLKYPDSDILVIDDDVIRPQGWLKCFIEDHKKYPNDVITGMVAQYLENGKFKMYPNREFGNTNYGTVIKDGRPANGRGGTLYPAHTFKDPRFFDEKLFMRLTPNSDESWQFYFNRKDGKNIRLISKQFDVSNFVKGTQEQPTALWKVNHRNNGYDTIWQNLKRELG